jgi:hypothetical protein
MSALEEFDADDVSEEEQGRVLGRVYAYARARGREVREHKEAERVYALWLGQQLLGVGIGDALGAEALSAQ